MMGDGNTCEYWVPSNCEGTRHCPPRCPRFVDDRGKAWLIRPYEPSDREALIGTYLDFDPGQRAQGLPPRTEREIENWLEYLLEEGCNFVAGAGDRVVGHVVYTPTDARVPELAVFVHQDYQNRGIGTELCRHVVATAAAADRDALVLQVKPGNTPAIRMYDTLGFERVDRPAAEDGTVGAGHAFEMRLPLSPSAAVDAQQPPAFRA